MTQVIQTPDGPVGFPDGMSHQQIAQVLRQKYPPREAHRSPLNDFVTMLGSSEPKSTANAVLQGIGGGIPGMVGIGMPHAPNQPISGDVMEIPQAMGRWAANKGGDVANQILRVLHIAPNAPPPQPASGNALQNIATPVANRVFGNPHPQGPAGEYGQAIGNFLGPATVMGGPGGTVTKTLGAVIPAVASETAGQLSRKFAPGHPKVEQAARLAAALVAGTASGTALGGPKTAPKLLGNALGDTTPEQRAATVALMQKGEDLGFTPTVTEAADYTIPGASAGPLAAASERTPAGSILRARYAERPGQVQSVMSDLLDRIAPPTDPSRTALGAQQAAEGAIGEARSGINARARPSYEALPGQEIPPSPEAQAALGDPSYTAALKAFRSNPELNRAPYNALPDNNLAVVNEVRKTLDDLKASVTPNPANPQGSVQLSSLRGQAGSNVDALAAALSPEWSAARGTVAQGHADILDPMMTGPLGRIASAEGKPVLASQTNALFPNQPPEGQAGVTADAMSRLGGAGADLLRAYIAKALGEAAHDQGGKPTTLVAGRLAQAISGNPNQAETLSAATNAVAPSVNQTLADALDVFKASGTRTAQGSSTVANMAQNQDIASGGHAAIAAFTGASKRMLLDRTMNFFDQISLEMNADQVAKAIDSNPQQAATLLDAAQAARGNTIQSRAAIGAAKSFFGANQDRGR